uniref:RING-type domain-containing protein n=1 Tax=viral metagenome TaxID=1070528 RepID=A0A6C0C415_9ZZZZ
MSDSATTNTSKYVAALQEHARRVQEWKAEKLNPKADQLLVDMGIKEDDTVPTCTITQEKIDYKNCVKTSCGHYFSCEEFWEWTKQSNKCPNCREELIQRDRSEELALKNLLDRRREIREQVREAYEEYDRINEKICGRNRVLKAKHEELQELKEEEIESREVNENIENSIQRNEEILEEMRLYKTNKGLWEKRMKRRERLEIHRGKDTWRTNIKEVHKQMHVNMMLRQGFRLSEIGWWVPREEEVDFSEIDMFDLPPEFDGVETRKTMCMWTEYEGPNQGNHRQVLEEGEVDEINWDSYDYIIWADRVESDSDMSIVNSDIDDMPELVESSIVTPPQSPRESTTPPPVERVSNWRNRSLNPQQFREFVNSLQPIEIRPINNNNDIVAQRTILQQLFDTRGMNPTHPDD